MNIDQKLLLSTKTVSYNSSLWGGEWYVKETFKRINDNTVGAIGEYQCGVRSGGGCSDQIFVVRMVFGKYLTKG